MTGRQLPAGVWDHPDAQDLDVYQAFVAAWYADTFDDAPVLSAQSYHDYEYEDPPDGDHPPCWGGQWYCQFVDCQNFDTPDCNAADHQGSGAEQGTLTQVAVESADDQGEYRYLWALIQDENEQYCWRAEADSTQAASPRAGWQIAYDEINAENTLTFSDQQHIWLLFRDVNIPAGSIIHKAQLEITGSSQQTESGTLRAGFRCVGNAELPVEEEFFNPASIPCCWSKLGWINWTVEDGASTSPDLAELIHEIVSHPNWEAGHNLVLYLADWHETGECPPETSCSSHFQVAGFGAGETPAELSIWWEEDIGGVVCGGDSAVITSRDETGAGGVVCGGSAHLPELHIETGMGGVLAGGLSLITTFVTQTATGGVVAGATAAVEAGLIAAGGITAGGAAQISGSTSHVASGGVVVGGSPLWLGRFVYRTTITIPAGKLSGDLHGFTVGIVADLPAAAVDTEFLVTTTDGRMLGHEVREWDGERLTLFFWTPFLSASEDNLFYLYHGTEEA